MYNLRCRCKVGKIPKFKKKVWANCRTVIGGIRGELRVVVMLFTIATPIIIGISVELAIVVTLFTIVIPVIVSVRDE